LKKSPELTIAVTLGDPAGIGPEVALRALVRPLAAARALLLGPSELYRPLARRLGLRLEFEDVNDPGARPAGRKLACFFPFVWPGAARPGRPDRAHTALAVRSIELGAELALAGEADAVATPPINKAALQRAGFTMPGHTEYLAELSHTKRYEMMLVGGGLRVVPVTRHMALRDVPSKLTAALIEEAIVTTAAELGRSFGIAKPRLVVCGLNPHAGESGRFGDEEIRVIAPAVRRARRRVLGTLEGPLSPDALFHEAYGGRWDAVICMYHDQGLIPLKMVSRGSGVNVTLGLPFVRTSPDHGTAYDIAGKFRADAGSMRESLDLAVTLASNRRRRA